MRDEHALGALVNEISDEIRSAAWGKSTWADVCGKITNLYPGTYCALLNEHRDRPEFGFAVSSGIDKALVDEFVNYYAFVNPWNRFWSGSPSGALLVTERDDPASLYNGTEFYEDWMTRVGDFDAAVGMLVRNSSTEKVYFPVHYSKRYSDVYDCELEFLFSRLKPVLLEAVRIKAQVREVAETQAALVAVINRDREVAFVVDEVARLQNANASAIHEFERGTLLSERNSCVEFASSSVNFRFRATCKALIANRRDAGGKFVVRHRDRRAIVCVSRLPDVILEGPLVSRPQFLVQITEPDLLALEPSLVLLADMYDLTVKEASLCLHLAAGSTLQDACAQAGISYENGRQRLKVIFEKTGVHTQADLRLILAKF